jgi:hypothetical protein
MSFGGTRADVGKVESILVCRRRADHRSRHQCVAEQPSCAPTFTTMYHCSSLLFGGPRADLGQCRSVLARGTVSTIDHRPRHPCTVAPLSCATRLSTMYQYSLSAFGETRQMSDNVDSSRRAVQCRPSTSPPVHGGTAFVCAKVAYDVPVLAVVEWLTARRCRTMSTRRGAWCSVDRRPRRPCAVAPPLSAPRLPTMYQYLLWWNDGLRADVGQCRLVEARGAVSTIDVAARAQWCRRRVRQGCL